VTGIRCNDSSTKDTKEHEERDGEVGALVRVGGVAESAAGV